MSTIRISFFANDKILNTWNRDKVAQRKCRGSCTRIYATFIGKSCTHKKCGARLDQLKVALNDVQIIMRQLMFHLFYGMVSVRVTLFLPATRMNWNEWIPLSRSYTYKLYSLFLRINVVINKHNQKLISILKNQKI